MKRIVKSTTVSTEMSGSKSFDVTEEQIRLRAYEIYCARLMRGEVGNALDWRRAQTELETSYPCES